MAENRTINDLAEIDIIPITITIGLVIHILSSIASDFVPNMKSGFKIQALERSMKIRKILRHRQRNLDKNLPHHCMMQLKRRDPRLSKTQS